MAPGVAGVDPAFECSWRQMAYDHAKALLPRHGARGFLAAFDALRLNELCGVPRPPAPAQPMPPSAAPIPPVSHIFYVDYTHGADSNSGAINAPLKTVAAAVTRRAAVQPAGQPAAIVLRSGVHVLSATIEFTTAHANTTITNYPGEQVIVTGAQPLRISNWKPYRVQQSNGCDTVSGVCLFNNTNDISGTYPSPLLYNASRTQTPEECAGLCARNASCLSFTWNSNIYPLEWNSTCWFRTDVHYWAPNVEGNHMAGERRREAA